MGRARRISQGERPGDERVSAEFEKYCKRCEAAAEASELDREAHGMAVASAHYLGDDDETTLCGLDASEWE